MSIHMALWLLLMSALLNATQAGFYVDRHSGAVSEGLTIIFW